jgi:lysophospholipase L1-like esterase
LIRTSPAGRLSAVAGLDDLVQLQKTVLDVADPGVVRLTVARGPGGRDHRGVVSGIVGDLHLPGSQMDRVHRPQVRIGHVQFEIVGPRLDADDEDRPQQSNHGHACPVGCSELRPGLTFRPPRLCYPCVGAARLPKRPTHLEDQGPVGRSLVRSQAVLTATLAIVSALIGLGLGEGVVRLLGLAPEVARILVDGAESRLKVSESPLQGYELKPGFTSRVHPGYRVNSQGLRGPERAIPKPPGVFRIALVGDSVVEGFKIRQDEDTISGQLESLLGGEGVEVLNAGVRGYNTQAEVELLRRQVLPYEPDLAIVVFVRNDHHDLNRHTGASWDYSRPRWAEGLFIHSHLFRLAAFRLNWFHFREELDPDYLDDRLGQAQTGDNVSAGLDDLARLSRAHGLPAIVVVWPNFGKTIKDPGGLVEPHSDRLRVETLAGPHDIPVIRLREAFARDYAERGRGQPTPRKLYTFDGMHPNPEGTRVAAAILAQLIEDRRLLNR